MGSAVPYRIDLFDEEIDSIRSFDVDTQRSIYKVNEVRLLPAREFPMDEAAQTRFRKAFRETFEGDPSKSRLYKDVSKGIPTAGIEYYLPLFFEQTASLSDYLPASTTVCVYPGLAPAMQAFWDEANSRYTVLRGDRANPVLAPQALFLTIDQFFGAIKRYPRIELDIEDAGGGRRETGGETHEAQPSLAPSRGEGTPRGATSTPSTTPLPPLAVERRADDPLHRIRAFVEQFGGRVLLVAESPGRRETMLEYFNEYGLHPATAASHREFLAATDGRC
jgi:transcription-repair coupling factor (superfamily II helicase)